MAHSIVSADEALKRLKEGNRRYVDGLKGADRGNGRADAAVVPTELVEEQDPFAIILGCSDARVPVETIFDQGLGELFVIRIAGNIVSPEVIGSIEYAASLLGTRLVVVLGHTRCGAVQASVSALQTGASDVSPHLQSIIDHVTPSVEAVLSAAEQSAAEEDSSAAGPPSTDEHSSANAPSPADRIIQRAVRANVRASRAQLLRDSKELETLRRNEGLQVVGAEYAVETGAVEFLDE